MNSQQIAELTTKAIGELAATLEAGHSETLAKYLAAMGRFHKYSLHNCMLIVLQKPDATHVAGFHTTGTNSDGRSVRAKRPSPSSRRFSGGKRSSKTERRRMPKRSCSVTTRAPFLT
jgi:hypothetical protein